jgi:DHA1 family bicyclomycin/chloramphenicol resistance-like MFS transporter
MASLTAITPLAIDAYLPAFLEISRDFGADISSVEASLSIYLLGFSLGQLIGGPASDRYGRKITANIGLGLYATFSLLIALISTSIEELLIFRFFQAFGGGFAVVNAAAIVRDNFEGKKSASTLSLIASIMMVAPMIAPAFGAFLLEFFGWKYIFASLGIYSLLVLYWIKLIPESSPKTKNTNPFRDYFTVITTKRALFMILTTSFAMSGMFVFIGKSSYIYMDIFKLSSTHFTILFALNVAALIFTSRLNVHLLKKSSQKRLIFFGILSQIGAAFLLALFSYSFENPYITAIFLMVFIGSIGLIFGNALSLILDFFHTMSGTANALVGVSGFATSSIMGFLASFLPKGLVYIFMFMFVTASISLTFFALNILSSKQKSE